MTRVIISHSGRRAGRASTLILAIVFGTLGVPVYLIGTKAPPVEDANKVRAVVRLPAKLITEDKAQRQVLAVPNVQRAIDICANEIGGKQSCPSKSVKSTRDRLRVYTSAGPSTDSSLASIHIECAFRENSDFSMALVNQLADQFAESERESHRAESNLAYRQAEQATAEARKKLTKAQDQFNAFVKECFEPMKKPPVKKKATAQRAKTKKVNPDWLAVKRQIDHVKAYRKQLLVDRTPLHPMVQAADVELEELEQRLAKIPHELVPVPGDLAETLEGMIDPLPQTPGLIGKAAEDVDTLDQPLGRFVPPYVRQKMPPEVVPNEQTSQIPQTPQIPPMQQTLPTQQAPTFATHKHFEKYLSLKNEVEVAQRNYDAAEAHQREVFQRGTDIPPIQVVAASIVAPPSSATAPPRSRAAIIALMVALAGTVGIGMITAGMGNNITFVDPVQARAKLPVPVLATLSGTDPAYPNARRRHLLEGAVLFLCGLFLLAASAGVLLAAGGIALILR